VCRIGGKAVQLHHLDDDRSNADVDNFAVLCVDCHNETQRKGGFGRQLNESQIRRYRDQWTAAVTDRLHVASQQTARGEAVIGAPEVRVDDVVARIVNEANRSPKVGLRLVDAEVEQEARRLLAGSGWGMGRTGWTVRSAIDRLFELGVVSQSIHISLDVLEQARVQLSSGQPMTNEDALRAVDVGLFTYRALMAIPRERHYVVESNLPVFEDEVGIHRIDGVMALRIRSVGPLPRTPRDQLALTGRGASYQVGDEVTWAWGGPVQAGYCLDLHSGGYVRVETLEYTGCGIETIA
jgi:hypothetical protein